MTQDLWQRPGAYNTNLKIRVKPAMVQAVNAAAQQQNVPVSAVIRAALETYLAEPAPTSATTARLVEKDF